VWLIDPRHQFYGIPLALNLPVRHNNLNQRFGFCNWVHKVFASLMFFPQKLQAFLLFSNIIHFALWILKNRLEFANRPLNA
jgi:hypothetical protein